MTFRGDHRSLYCAMADDETTQSLSHAAFRLFVVLKLTLPAAGIGVAYVSLLAERSHMTAAEVEQALAELLSKGIVQREGRVVWIVNGLRFEPSLNARNEKHRAFVRDRSIAPLGDLPIVAAFRAAYAEWFTEPNPENQDSPSHGYQPRPSRTYPSRSSTSPSARPARATKLSDA